MRPSQTTSPPIRSITSPSVTCAASARRLRHERHRHLEHRLERVHGHRLVGLVVALGAVREVHHRQARRDEDVGVAAAAGVDVDGLDAVLLERGRRHLDRRRGARQPVAPEQALDRGLDVALEVGGRLGERVHHLAHHLAGALGVEAARLELHVAALRHHVRRRAALDAAHVRGRLRVQPADPHRGDRPRGRGDRVVPRLGPDPRVRGLAPEARLQRVVGRRGEHDLADRRGVVEDVAEVGARGGAMSNAFAPFSACSSPVVNSSSMPAGGSPVAQRAGGPRP